MLTSLTFGNTGTVQSPGNQSRNNGFSLVELLIVIAIIGLLAAVGYPSYTQYVKETRRSDGHLALMSAVQAMERCKSTRYSYAGCALTATAATSPEGHYTLALTPAPTATTFTVVATAAGIQVKDTDCTSMSIDQRGVRASLPGTAGQDDNGCWD